LQEYDGELEIKYVQISVWQPIGIFGKLNTNHQFFSVSTEIVKHKELSVQSEWKNMKIHSNNSRLSVTSL
jgi:hypothetical protein